MSYDDHGYEDGINITTSTIEYLPIQIKKLYLFSKYTRLELETTKYEATGALWGYGNLIISKTNTTLLVNQIGIIKFDDGFNIKYQPPNKAYKMLGVQINTMLDFRKRSKHVTTYVRQIAKAVTKKNYP